MSAELIQDAIVTQLKNDTATAAVFGVNVQKGVGRNFDFQNELRGIRVYLALENFSRKTLPNNRQEAAYPFMLVILFYETNEATGETLKTQYSKLIRTAIEKDIKLGGTCFESRLGDTRFYFHPDVNGAHYIVVPLAAKKRETVG